MNILIRDGHLDLMSVLPFLLILSLISLWEGVVCVGGGLGGTVGGAKDHGDPGRSRVRV